ncbi:Zinc finger A20 and AN1 domain-containing stress-associated protein 8 [Apostasia shenzhenica]|uniref:Zinc finger A20 and AN1 domain-containing stress-associated protein 8 n=1 Tax=Apostasia shenzhenica TaxID=1088818 RepID=A0A2I0A4K4_9ASPA|nr:Zinc finger A20 and AN1 domain-containing stress-associated protein 8 [Apostasia shenzhenica]
MEHDETGCQNPERPILCINNCGFFGSLATMNMCSKCHKDHILKQEQAKLVASSIDNAVNGAGSSSSNELIASGNVNIAVASAEREAIGAQASDDLGMNIGIKGKEKEGPNRCSACKKRVGLTGFNCRCGNLFCAAHRYSDKHNCTYDYHTEARDAIAKSNPVVKAEKLDKI